MAWFKRSKKPKPVVAVRQRSQVPEGLWVKCDNCKEIVYKKEVLRASNVCPKCNYHFRISARERLGMLLDEGAYEEFDADMVSELQSRARDALLAREIASEEGISDEQIARIRHLRPDMILLSGGIDSSLIALLASRHDPDNRDAAYEQAAAQLEPEAVLAKLNTEEAPRVEARFGIQSIPTLVVFKGGREVARQPGAMSLPQIEQWVRAHAG